VTSFDPSVCPLIIGGQSWFEKVRFETPNANLIVILHELNNDSDVIRVVFDGDDSHDVGSILSVRVLAIFVRQYETSICLMHLFTQSSMVL